MRRCTRLFAALAALLAIVATGCGVGAQGAQKASAPQSSRPNHVVAQSVGEPDPAPLTPIMHTVAVGEQLSNIAKQYQVEWKRLFDANPTLQYADGHTSPFADQDVLPVGASLRIPFYWETFASRPLHVDPPVVKLKVELASYSRAAQSTSADAPPPQSSRLSGDPSDATFDRLAGCEAGGRWNLNTGNGYYGGLQFSASTWHSLGGSGLPSDHSRGEQIELGRKQWRQSRWHAWPSCSRQLGLR